MALLVAQECTQSSKPIRHATSTEEAHRRTLRALAEETPGGGGLADVLESLGVRVDLDPTQVVECVDEGVTRKSRFLLFYLF